MALLFPIQYLFYNVSSRKTRNQPLFWDAQSITCALCCRLGLLGRHCPLPAGTEWLHQTVCSAAPGCQPCRWQGCKCQWDGANIGKAMQMSTMRWGKVGQMSTMRWGKQQQSLVNTHKWRPQGVHQLGKITIINIKVSQGPQKTNKSHTAQRQKWH